MIAQIEGKYGTIRIFSDDTYNEETQPKEEDLYTFLAKIIIEDHKKRPLE